MSLKVSVITLSYNSMDHILETIDSIIEQTYPQIEIIVADDCSASFDRDIIEKFITKHNKGNIVGWIVYQNEQNLGTVKNMNTAVQNASGDIIINLSSGDNFYRTDTVQRIVEDFIRTNCDLLLTRRALFEGNTVNILTMMPNDYEISQIQKFSTAQQEYEGLLTGRIYNMASGCALSYRREMMLLIGMYDESYRLWEDGPFFAKYLLERGMMHYNYDIISIYYRYGGISTTGMSDSMRKDATLFLKRGLQNPILRYFARRQTKFRLDTVLHKNMSIARKVRNVLAYFDVYMIKVFYYIKKMTNTK